MKRAMAVVAVCLLAVQAFGGGASLCVENDCWTGSDSDYTHGTEFMYMGDLNVDGSRWEYGLRELMYTPANIKIATPQPGEHPWFATLGVFAAKTWVEKHETVRMEVYVGTSGKDAFGEQFQTFVHKIVGSPKPMGWDNQAPGEPFVNVRMDRVTEIWKGGNPNKWCHDIAIPYGFEVGTIFDDAFMGVQYRAGWNLPPTTPSLIRPSAVRSSGLFAYVLGGLQGKLVGHNSSINGSMFDDEGQREEIEPFVTETRLGACAGYAWKDFEVDFGWSVARRSHEYVAQDEETDLTSLRLTVIWGF